MPLLYVSACFSFMGTSTDLGFYRYGSTLPIWMDHDCYSSVCASIGHFVGLRTIDCLIYVDSLGQIDLGAGRLD